MKDWMDSKMKDLKAKVLGKVPNAAQYTLLDHENNLWTEGLFGRDTSRNLIYTLIFDMNKNIS